MPQSPRSALRFLPSLLLVATLAPTPLLAEGTPLRLAELSARVYAAGHSAGDPIVLLAAATMRRNANLPAVPLTPEAIYAEAATLAEDDPKLLALIDDLQAETSKGVASGPIYQLAALAVGEIDSRPPMPFRGGTYAEVYVEAAPGADLDLTVLDDAGHVVCADREDSHIAYCGWTPANDGNFTLLIENAGAVPADYALMTN
ncbi:hypothetical protein Q9295_06235 [Xinfangfangia sp. CPCC 101601]|uniref:Uncharacterized protein n=1 Tax=Pseudogemmobacter lacusdianii TaxID=3069608 RepID=A0ABU0VW37_9RHOB|nr:hypothetical protein [Xinfangfangia sp. CPCC 101601]MDQ2065962.1 hypothetical protein [Xinfangfangia sp. CPCC 101601]